MQFIVAIQIAVEAETPEEAVAKKGEGVTIAISVNPRAQRPTAAVQRPVSLAPQSQ